MTKHSIGIFDSGYGGLTILGKLLQHLPQYDYMYLGDNARSPYGDRSFETIYQYTKEGVEWLFHQHCPLVILACNTASAKALRSIQQHDMLPLLPYKRVLGVIRPTAEIIGNLSPSKHIGILATQGTVTSQSYPIEIKKFFPHVNIFQQACPMLVPLIENHEHQTEGARFFIQKYIQQLLHQSADIDTILLGCTHYPLIMDQIQSLCASYHTKKTIQVISQGDIVANSLQKYLWHHAEIDSQLTKNGEVSYYTTDTATDFNKKAMIFLHHPIQSNHISFD